MSEYKGLKYKTNGNASPQGRCRVYFCCHPDDFDKDNCFEGISKEILDLQSNTAIWYYDPKDGTPDGEDYFLDLSRMQLFVIPITTKFLFNDNYARTVAFQYAIEHHIPVLPLMQESGLEEDFNRVCGDLQFLDKAVSSMDITVLPYEEKLKKFLESVLVSDELAEKIRNAFDAYIFLSYRKKDRKYAQEIMRLIHENDFCRDIAIWYDEFLVPGENFNDAIAAAMEKCSLFTLAVTPNLLENPNYVMTTEYPVAIESGKPVLPIEAVETDKKSLKKYYTTLGEVHSTDDSKAISDDLAEALKNVALRSNDGDPQHNFFIGLAYLSGIDVEVNAEKALELITFAAEGGVPEAYKKLVSMYNNGEGVERNYKTAIEWQKKYVSHLESTTDSLKTRELFIALYYLGDMCWNVGAIKEVESAFKKMTGFAIRRFESNRTIANCRDIGLSFSEMGNLYERWNPEEGEKMHEASLTIFEQLAKMTDAESIHLALGVKYKRKGDICGKRNVVEAKEWYEKARTIFEQFADETGSINARKNLGYIYKRFGTIYREEKKFLDARKWHEKALYIFEQLAYETGTVGARRDLNDSYNHIASICIKEKNFAEAREWYKKSLNICKQLVKETDEEEEWKSFAWCYAGFGEICLIERNFSEAKKWYKKEIDIFEHIEKETTEREKICLNLCYYYSRLEIICELEEKLSEAEEWHEKAHEICQIDRRCPNSIDESLRRDALREINTILND